jgi:predicted Zn-dependent protease
LWQLDRQIENQPKDALAHALRAKVHRELDHVDLAAADFDRAAALGPHETILPTLRAFAVQASDRKQRQHALWYLDRLVQIEPRQAFAWRLRSWS